MLSHATITNLMYKKFEFAVIVTKFLQEKQIILVVVLIFGLVLSTIVISSVLQDHIVLLQRAKFLAIKGIKGIINLQKIMSLKELHCDHTN